MAGPVQFYRRAPGSSLDAAPRMPALTLIALLVLVVLTMTAHEVSPCGALSAEERNSNRRLHNYAEHLDATTGPNHDHGATLLHHHSNGARYPRDGVPNAAAAAAAATATGGGPRAEAAEEAEEEEEAEPTGDEYSDPESRRAVSKAFAVELDPPGRVRAAASYREAKEQCAWEMKAASDLLNEPCYRHTRNSTAFLGENLELYSPESRYMFCPRGRAASLRVRTCHVSADASDAGSMSGESFWRITRIGPFKGNGANEWHIFRLKDAGGLSVEMQHGSSLWITGKLFGVAAANGTLLPSPPIHIHHAHIQPDSIWQVHNDTMDTGPDDLSWWEGSVATEGLRWVRAGHEVWYETHGDSACHDGTGGTDCLIETLPEGFGVELPASSGGLALDTDIVDVRPEGSEEIEFFIEMAIRWTRKPKRPLRRLQIHRTGRSRFATYRLSSTSSTMNWGSAAVPHSGRFMYSYFHGHREFFDSFLVFAATPEQLGIASMHSSPRWPHKEAEAYELEPHGSSVPDSQARLLKHLAKSQMWCRMTGNCTQEPEMLCAFLNAGREQPPGREGAEWDRYGVHSTDCNNIFVKKGTVITQVMFHPPTRDPGLNTAHSIFRGLFYMGGRDYGQDKMTAAMPVPLVPAEVAHADRAQPWPFLH